MNMQGRKTEMSYKKGVNTSDKAKVLAMIEQGAKAQEISEALKIDLAVIEWFFPKAKAKPKTKPQKKAEVKDDGNVDE